MNAAPPRAASASASAPADASANFAIEQLSPDFGFYLRVGRVLATHRSPLQSIEIVDTPAFGRALRIDGCFMTSERDEFFYHEPMIHLPAISHGGPRAALVIGGGDGGAIEELLKYPGMEQVVLAELDGDVIDLSRRWLPAIHRGAFDDPRLELKITDGRDFVENSARRFDQIVLDLTDPFGPALALYSRAFYRACQAALRPGGVLSLHIQSPIHRPATLARIFASLRSVFARAQAYLQYVPLYGTLWGMAMASDSVAPGDLPAAAVDARIAGHGLADLQLYDGGTHHALLNLPPFVRALLARPAAPIDDGDQLDDDSLDLHAHMPLRLIPG